MLRARCFLWVVGALMATPAFGAVQFLVSDGDKLFRADSTGSVLAPITLSHPIQSLTVVPGGFSLPGTSGGDVIAARHSPVSGQWGVYRVDDPFGAAPTLTQIGATSFGVGSMVFAGADIYAVNDSLSPIRVSRLNPLDFSVIQTWNTGISASGGGGIAWDPVGSRFLLTNYTANTLVSWTPSAGATTIGPIGFGFSNNGIELHNGTLYGALRPDSAGTTLRLGSFNLTTGAFTTLATATGIAGNGTGFVAIPEPQTAVMLALGAACIARRRRCAGCRSGRCCAPRCATASETQ